MIKNSDPEGRMLLSALHDGCVFLRAFHAHQYINMGIKMNITDENI